MADRSLRLSLLSRGTGKGATAVYGSQARNSIVLVADGDMVLFAGNGFGVVRYAPSRPARGAGG